MDSAMVAGGSPGTVTLIGSGEMAASMTRVHRSILSRIDGPLRAVFIDTPAGFQLNLDQLAQDAVDYFRRYLKADLAVVSYPSKERATQTQTQNVVATIRTANLIFAGPGSPSYAVLNWKDTPVIDAIAERLAAGAHLVCASAAAISLSRKSVPVYEVYKAGLAPYWLDGLDLLAPYALDLAIITHWNNTEGGTYDTRFAYMGQPRLEYLESLLDPATAVLGIDEYTACILDLAANEALVMGAGGVVVRRRGDERVFESGERFSLDELRGVAARPKPAPAASEAERVAVEKREALLDEIERVRRTAAAGGSLAELPVLASHLLAHAVEEATAAGVEADVMGEARDALRSLLLSWGARPEAPREELVAEVAPFVEMLIELRRELRAQKQFALADSIRDRLLERGIQLEDTPEGTTWRRSSSSGGQASA